MNMIPIGTIHSPFTDLKGMPIQPSGAGGITGTVNILDEYAPGLKDLEGFSHVILLYVFHRSKAGHDLEVTPFMDSTPRGLFATRAPRRPNPIGLSIVQLDNIEDGKILHISNVDILDGTPVLDIKPYVPKFDDPSAANRHAATGSGGSVRTGWLEKSVEKIETKKSDDRFE